MTTHKRTIALDFDGTIHLYTSGWTTAAEVLDPPTPGAFEFMEQLLAAGWEIVIHTMRMAYPEGQAAMVSWFTENGFDPSQLRFSLEKPKATVYLDDRAVAFSGRWPTVRDLEEFQPWIKGGESVHSPDWYQRNAVRTTNRNLAPVHDLSCLLLGLAGETGELVDAIKKQVFHKVAPGGEPTLAKVHESKELIREELGDICWYVANIADRLGISLESVMLGNVEKLRSRYPAGFSPPASEARVDNPFLAGTDIEITPLKSSNVIGIGILTAKRAAELGFEAIDVVEARFSNGGAYRYRGAKEAYDVIMQAVKDGGSAGSAFAAFLRGWPPTQTAVLRNGHFVPLV